MEPTIAMLVAALSAGAAAGLKETAAASIKDAYSKLKALVQERDEDFDADALEREPGSEERQRAVAKRLENADLGDEEPLKLAARDLLVEVRRHDAAAAKAAGVVLEDFEVGGDARIHDVKAEGAGVSVRRAKVAGDFEIRGVNAGREGLAQDP